MKLKGGFAVGLMVVAAGCSGKGGFGPGDDGGPTDKDGGNQSDSPFTQPDGYTGFGDSGNNDSGNPGGSTTVYAHTDDTLYTLDPKTNMVTMIGKFAGFSGSDTGVTDLAVDAAGDVYVNSETNLYSAAVPTSPGAVNLTLVHSISVATGQKFYALAFTPANAIDPSEVLIGGDGKGEIWSIDKGTGATVDLGNFGPDPKKSGNILALSGDIVFYMDAMMNPLGLATVRSCTTGGSCSYSTGGPYDYLVAVDMAALKSAYSSKSKATTLLKGVYGGSSGTGVGHGDLFGLGAWGGTVYAFARPSTYDNNTTPLLLTIDTMTGVGTVVSSAFSFTNGWSGAGVTTSAPITVPLPN